MYATVPKITITGKYKIDGRVLVLPIQGEGDAHLIFDNADLIVKYKPKVIEKNGKKYVQTEKFQLDFDTTQLHINLENLFNGDKVTNFFTFAFNTISYSYVSSSSHLTGSWRQHESIFEPKLARYPERIETSYYICCRRNSKRHH